VILYALRHAATPAAAGPVGRLDVPIVGTHAAAAEAALHALGARARPTVVWSSPLSRCGDTARALATRLRVPHALDERLLEISYGEWEGRRWDDLPSDATAAWMRDWEHHGPPGGESAQAVGRRVAEWLAALPGTPQLLIAHAGVVRALRVLLAGSTWPDAMAVPVAHLGQPEAMAEFRT